MVGQHCQCGAGRPSLMVRSMHVAFDFGATLFPAEGTSMVVERFSPVVRMPWKELLGVGTIDLFCHLGVTDTKSGTLPCLCVGSLLPPQRYGLLYW